MMIKELVSDFISNIELEDYFFAVGFFAIAYLYIRVISQLNCGFVLSQ
jgi:hypothetical protein